MKKEDSNLLAQASLKSSEPAALEEHLPLLDLILEMKHDIEAVSAELGLKIMARYMNQEIERRCGPWGEQSHYRHGTQSGYVVFHGRKVPLQRPRLRDKAAGEAALQSDRFFNRTAKCSAPWPANSSARFPRATTPARLTIASQVMASVRAA